MVSIVDVASEFNFAFNSGNRQMAEQLSGVLYNEVGPKKQGGRALLELSDYDCQCVGLAFATIAMCYEFGDEDINSVAAENSYYCLARNIINKENSYCAPAIFSILYNVPHLLNSMFVKSWCMLAQEEVKMPIFIMLGGNPLYDPKLSDFRKQAIGFMENVKYYLLTKFYDIDKSCYIIPIDLPYHIPSEKDIKTFLSKVGEHVSSTYLVDAERHFVSVYKRCEAVLAEF